jgi:hypothetical protein
MLVDYVLCQRLPNFVQAPKSVLELATELPPLDWRPMTWTLASSIAEHALPFDHHPLRIPAKTLRTPFS